MVSVKESEQLGNAINMLEAINNYSFSKQGKLSINMKFFIHNKIEKIIEFIDGVVL